MATVKVPSIFVMHTDDNNRLHIFCFGEVSLEYLGLSYNVASESEIVPCIKINKPLVVYRFWGNVMTSIKTLST